MKSLAYIIFYILVTNSNVYSDDVLNITGKEKSVIYKELVKVIGLISKIEKENPIADNSSNFNLMRYAHTDQGRETAAAMVVLWKRGEAQYVMKRWWSSEDSIIRTTIGLLLFTQPVGAVVQENTLDQWKKYAAKFHKKEALARERELVAAYELSFIIAKNNMNFKTLVGEEKERFFHPY